LPDESSVRVANSAEQRRLDEVRERGVAWRQWGPYLSERQWGTVREDYSENGDAWNYFSHGAGIGASHQTGWTGVVAALIEIFGKLDAQAVLQGGREAVFGREMEMA
jgi:hypothetical protein